MSEPIPPAGPQELPDRSAENLENLRNRVRSTADRARKVRRVVLVANGVALLALLVFALWAPVRNWNHQRLLRNNEERFQAEFSAAVDDPAKVVEVVRKWFSPQPPPAPDEAPDTRPQAGKMAEALAAHPSPLVRRAAVAWRLGWLPRVDGLADLASPERNVDLRSAAGALLKDPDDGVRVRTLQVVAQLASERYSLDAVDILRTRLASGSEGEQTAILAFVPVLLENDGGQLTLLGVAADRARPKKLRLALLAALTEAARKKGMVRSSPQGVDASFASLIDDPDTEVRNAAVAMLAFLGAVDAWAPNPAVRPLFFDRGPECAALTLHSAVVQLAAPVWDRHPALGMWLPSAGDFFDYYLSLVAGHFLFRPFREKDQFQPRDVALGALLVNRAALARIGYQTATPARVGGEAVLAYRTDLPSPPGKLHVGVRALEGVKPQPVNGPDGKTVPAVTVYDATSIAQAMAELTILAKKLSKAEYRDLVFVARLPGEPEAPAGPRNLLKYVEGLREELRPWCDRNATLPVGVNLDSNTGTVDPAERLTTLIVKGGTTLGQFCKAVDALRP